MQDIKLAKTEFVKELLAKTFPGYKGRTFRYQTVTSFYFDPYWGGGSRTSYAIVDMATGRASRYDANFIAPWNNPDTNKRVPIPENVIVVTHIIFCGKDCGIRFLVNPLTAEAFATPALSSGAQGALDA